MLASDQLCFSSTVVIMPSSTPAVPAATTSSVTSPTSTPTTQPPPGEKDITITILVCSLSFSDWQFINWSQSYCQYVLVVVVVILIVWLLIIQEER